MKKVICPICNKSYLIENNESETFSICDNCFWENDPFVDYSDPYDYSDVNKMTIDEAKTNVN